jgi:hypothetical protein
MSTLLWRQGIVPTALCRVTTTELDYLERGFAWPGSSGAFATAFCILAQMGTEGRQSNTAWAPFTAAAMAVGEKHNVFQRVIRTIRGWGAIALKSL